MHRVQAVDLEHDPLYRYAATPMIHIQTELVVATPGRGLTDLSSQIASFVRNSGIEVGTCLVYCTHTSCSLVIQENADPSASRDLLAWLERIAPDGDPHYTHTAEGPDDMPSHLRSAVTKTSETIPIVAGALGLGTWQGVFLAEHRTAPHTRRIILHANGMINGA